MIGDVQTFTLHALVQRQGIVTDSNNILLVNPFRP